MPPSLTSCASTSRSCAPLRDRAARLPRRRIELRGRQRSSNGARPGDDGAADARRRARPSRARRSPCPELPIGRHRLIVDGVDCALTIAPPEAYGPKARCASASAFRRSSTRMRRARRPGRSAISRRWPARARRRERAGAAYLGVSPLHMLFPHDRERASPYHPSDRRFLDPIHDRRRSTTGLPRDDELDAALAASRRRDRVGSRAIVVDYRGRLGDQARRRSGRAAAAFARAAPPAAGSARSRNTRVRHAPAARRCGASPFSRRSRASAAARTGGAGRSRLRDGDASALDAWRSSATGGRDFALFCQWLADRQLAARRGASQRERPRNRLLSRSRGRRGARRRRSLGARAANSLQRRHRRRAARSVLGAGPELELARRPIRSPARATAGAASSRSLAANMRHAGMLRIDHAMGLARLFVIPDGAKPAEGAYLAYPARRSHRPYRAREPARTNAWWSARISAPCRKASATS